MNGIGGYIIVVMKKIAVILSGCGYLDGSEIRESVGVLWALSRKGVQAQCFAPDSIQADVVNTLTGQSLPGEQRNMRIEAARIARGDVLPLEELLGTTGDYSGIILPGGYGVAKNLCDFAAKGSAGSVHPELQSILQSMHRDRKRIGAVCISPALVALAFRGEKLELTLGEQGEAAAEIEKLGHKHIVCAADQCHLDAVHGIVSTPAYMMEHAPLHEIFEGIRKLVDQVVQ